MLTLNLKVCLPQPPKVLRLHTCLPHPTCTFSEWKTNVWGKGTPTASATVLRLPLWGQRAAGVELGDPQKDITCGSCWGFVDITAGSRLGLALWSRCRSPHPPANTSTLRSMRSPQHPPTPTTKTTVTGFLDPTNQQG